jgi:hypothetical protein
VDLYVRIRRIAFLAISGTSTTGANSGNYAENSNCGASRLQCFLSGECIFSPAARVVL